MDAKKKPFTAFEKELITSLVEKFADIIECRKTDSAASRKKAEAWEAIAHEFNQASLIQERATSKQIKKYLANCKVKARESKTLENQRKMTGGGPSIPNMTPDDEAVLSVISNVLPTIKSIDCDDYVDPDADDDGFSWKPKKDRYDLYDNVVIEETIVGEVKQSNSLGTPIVEIDEVQQSTSLRTPIRTPALKTTSAEETVSRKRKLLYPKKNNEVSLDYLKIQIVEEERAHRIKKYEIELNHLEKMARLKEEEQYLKIEILKLELENKKNK